MSKWLSLLLLVPASIFANYRYESQWEWPDYDEGYQEAVVESYYEPAEEQIIESFQEQKEEEVVIPKANSSYRLKIGDVLLVQVYGEPHTEKEVMVDPTGSISYLFINGMKVIGHTVKEVRAELQERLANYYRFPLVAMTPVKFAGEFYTIMGEVNSPGKKLIEGHTTVLSALCAASGFTLRDFRDQMVEQADLRRSFLSRNGEFVPLDFMKLVVDGDMTQDILLKSGDFLFIDTNIMHQVFVLGMVDEPIVIDFVQTISLAEALAEAGGRLYEASSRVVVVRGSLNCPVTYLVDVNRILKGGACDFLLEPGDIVYAAPMKFTSLKEVAQSAIRSFVSTVAATAGAEAFVKTHPHAEGDPFIQPVNTVSGGFFIP